MNFFNIGDRVILIHANGIFNLQINYSYKVIDVDMNYNGDQLIALEGIENDPDEYKKYPYFNSKRFEKDIKFERKTKLNKIYDI